MTYTNDDTSVHALQRRAFGSYAYVPHYFSAPEIIAQDLEFKFSKGSSE